MIERSVPTQDLCPIAGPCGLATPEIGERHVIAEVDVPRVAREQRTRVRIDLGDDEGRGRASRDAQDPFDVRGHRQTPGLAGSVLDPQPRDFHRIVHRHELEETQEDAMGRVLEATVALTMPGDVGRRVLPDGQRRWAPQVTGLFVPDIDGLTGRVADGIVGPRRQLILPAVARPGVAGPALGDLEAERGIRDDVDPGRGRPLPLSEDGDVLPPVVDEPSQPVEELELRAGRRRVVGGRGSRRAAAGRGGRARRDSGTRELLRERAVSTQEDGSRGRLQGIALGRLEQVLPQDEDLAVCLVPLVTRRRLARPDQRLERRLELLHVGVRPLVQNDEIDRQPLQAPVLVRAEELSDDASILRLVDADQDDGEVAGDPVGPQGRRPGRILPQHHRRGPKRRVRVKNPARKILEQASLVHANPEMVELDLRPRPGKRDRPLERRGVAILVGERHGGFARRADERGEDEPCALSRRETNSPPETEDWIEHRAGRVRQGPPVDDRHRRTDPATPADETVRGRSRTERLPRTGLRRRRCGRPRSPGPSPTGRGESPAGPRDRLPIPSGRRGWKRPDARYPPPAEPARVRRRTSARSLASAPRGS